MSRKREGTREEKNDEAAAQELEAAVEKTRAVCSRNLAQRLLGSYRRARLLGLEGNEACRLAGEWAELPVTTDTLIDAYLLLKRRRAS